MHHKPPSPYRHLLTGAKLLAAGLLLAWLAWQAQQNDRFQELIDGKKQWGVLLLAFLLTGATTLLTFVRWYWVGRAAGVPIRLSEAVRLGALGYTLNFVSPGAVGGDLFKAALLAKDRAGHRTAAVTTVVVDRALALVSFLLFASLGFFVILATGAELPIEARTAGWVAVGFTLGTPIVLGLLMLPGVMRPEVIESVGQFPWGGHIAAQVMASWAEYRHGLKDLAAAFLICVIGHLLMISAFYCVAVGLPIEAPSWLQHAFMVPFAALSGSIPLFPAGLGAMEGTLEFFYQWLGSQPGNGALVAFGYRLCTLAVAAIAAPYYFTHQAIVKRGLAEAEFEP